MAVAAMVVAPVIFVAVGVANAVPSTLGPCAGDLTGTTFTLTADCATTAPVIVTAGITTVSGAGPGAPTGGFTISASDTPSAQWNGAILQIPPGRTVTVENLTVSGPATGFSISTNANFVVYGILFNDSSGTVNNVTVEHIWQQPNASGAPSPNTGTAIRSEGPTAGRTVTITNTTVFDYQKNGIDGRGAMTMNLSGNTIGPPANLEGFIAANGIVYLGGASGTATNNTIQGSGDQQLPGPPGGGTNASAVLLWGATGVTIDHNIITGAKTDIGVAVTDGNGDGTGTPSTNITISFNQIGRTSPDAPDPTGHGIDVLHPPSSATLICNTFTNWNANVVGAVQMSCTTLPNGTECTTYSANIFTVQGGTPPFTWSVSSGSLPPGLTMAPADGSITGSNPTAGTFNFTVMVSDSSEPTLTATQPQTITITPCAAATTTVPPTEPPSTAAPTTAPSVAPTMPATLPPTGSESRAPLYVGAVLFVLGALVVTVTTRRRARQS
jgi:hypothetical protein